MGLYKKLALSVRLLGVVVILLAVTVSCTGGESTEDDFKLAFEESIGEVGDVDRRYGDEDIEQLVDEFIHGLNVDARYSTPAERRASEEEFDYWLSFEASQVERSQHLFELSLEMQMLEAYHTLPAVVGQGGELEQAFERALNDCAAEAGWPGIELQNKSMSHAEMLETERGLPLDTQLALAYECSKVAETYPTLTPERREELLKLRRDHYLSAARSALARDGE